MHGADEAPFLSDSVQSIAENLPKSSCMTDARLPRTSARSSSPCASTRSLGPSSHPAPRALKVRSVIDVNEPQPLLYPLRRFLRLQVVIPGPHSGDEQFGKGLGEFSGREFLDLEGDAKGEKPVGVHKPLILEFPADAPVLSQTLGLPRSEHEILPLLVERRGRNSPLADKPTRHLPHGVELGTREKELVEHLGRR